MVYEKNKVREHLWNDNSRGKPIPRAENLSQCHSLPQMPRGVTRERLATNQLSYAMGYWDIYIYISSIYALCHGNILYEYRRAQIQVTETSGMFRFKPVNTKQYMYMSQLYALFLTQVTNSLTAECLCKFSGKEIHKELRSTQSCWMVNWIWDHAVYNRHTECVYVIFREVNTTWSRTAQWWSDRSVENFHRLFR